MRHIANCFMRGLILSFSPVITPRRSGLQQIRALEDNRVAKLTSALNEEAIARARMTSADPGGRRLSRGLPAGIPEIRADVAVVLCR